METRKNVSYRNSVRALVLLAAMGGFSVAHAGYAQLVPPSGWSAGTGATVRATFQAGAAAGNDAVWVANTVRTSAALNVAGRAVVVPAAMRLASNAPLFVAGRLGSGLAAGLLSPIGIGLTVASFLVIPAVQQWINENGDVIYKGNGQFQLATQGEGVVWVGREGSGEFGDALSACKQGGFADWVVVSVVMRSELLGECFNQNGVLLGQVNGVKKQTVGLRDAPYSEVEPFLANHPLPVDFPENVPMPLPVDDPVINPSPSLQPQPLNVPTGDPVPVPDTNPQQYKKPAVEVKPSPTSDNPWRVDVTDKPVVSTDPTPIKDPVTKDPLPDSSDICKDNPGILACAKPDLDIPDGDIPKTSKQITYVEESPFGGGSCPADVMANVGTLHQSIKVWDWQKTCEYALPLRALIVGLAGFAAFLIVMPGSPKV